MPPIRRYIADHHRARTDDSTGTDDDAGCDSGAGADQSAFADRNAAAKCHPRCCVGKVADIAVVVDAREGVDDGTPSQATVWLDHRSCKDLATGSELCARTKLGGGVDDSREMEADGRVTPEKKLPYGRFANPQSKLNKSGSSRPVTVIVSQSRNATPCLGVPGPDPAGNSTAHRLQTGHYNFGMSATT